MKPMSWRLERAKTSRFPLPASRFQLTALSRWFLKYCVSVGLLLVGAPLALAAQGPPPKATYDPGGRRDPFAPLVVDGHYVTPQETRGFPGTKPELYGILWDPTGTSIALINDTEAKVGDKVGDYQVAEIRKDAVVLRNGGEPLVLTISFDSAEGSSVPTGGGGQ